MLKTLEKVDPAFRADVLNGLAEPIPAIPARWLYDRRGSELFDEITRLPDYYPTRTETALLEAKIGEIARLLPPDSAVVEFGSGSSTKTPILLRAAKPKAYVPIDISRRLSPRKRGPGRCRVPGPRGPSGRSRLHQGCRASRRRSTGCRGSASSPDRPSAISFPQSATDLLRHFRDILGTGAKLLIGMDRVKPIDRLIAAYDDPEGVTAEFNLNLLRRINRELDADIPVDAFRHQARWNDMLGRIEMHLVATRDVEFEIEGRRFAFAKPASRSTPRTATNMARAAPGCCCSPAAGPRSPNGPTRTRISR